MPSVNDSSTPTSPTYVPTSPAYTPSSPGYAPSSPILPVAVTNVGVGAEGFQPRTPSPPPEVTTDRPSGVEDGALELAKQFMAKMGNLARKCRTRGQLSELYLTTFKAWASEQVQSDSNLERHFKQVLFAIAHGMKLVRVRDQGHSLFWNRYRDNNGEPIEEERAKFHERRQQRSRDYDDRRPRDYDDRRPRDYDDRRYRSRDYDDRRYRPRDYDDRRYRPRDYDDRRYRPRDYDDRRQHRPQNHNHRGQERPSGRPSDRQHQHQGRD